MQNTKTIACIDLFFFFFFSATSAHSHENFLECLVSAADASISDAVHTPANSSFSSLYLSSIYNLRFLSPLTPKPILILTPLHESHVSALILCSVLHRFHIRTRSGGHDSEGLSYVSSVPFVLLDLSNLRSVLVDSHRFTAWVQAGATLGELYYWIYKQNRTLTFPAALGASIGVGGHVCAAGYGNFVRKFGTAADNVVDARVATADGRILDRESMGEDLFWAIRGGGGSSFGVILAYKLRLVRVPEKVTLFEVHKTLDQNATQILHRWQYVAPRIDKDLTIRVSMVTTASGEREEVAPPKVVVTFLSTFLGGVDKLLEITRKEFPEMGLERHHCTEMTWMDAVLHFNEVPDQPFEVLLQRGTWPKAYLKVKSDYVTDPVGEEAFRGMFERLSGVPAGAPEITMAPYGGVMEEIGESEVAFPHRAGTLYLVFYGVYWGKETSAEEVERRLGWVRGLYEYMTPFVSKWPRGAYLPYRDIDLGEKDGGGGSDAGGRVWGEMYFKGNFERLVRVKTEVDPENFFWDEQSIPPGASVAQDMR